MDKKSIRKFIKKVAGEDIDFEFLYLPMLDVVCAAKDGVINRDESTKIQSSYSSYDTKMQVYYKTNLNNANVLFTKPIIQINKYWLNELDNINPTTKDFEIKASLLHEIGHIKERSYINKSRAMDEYLTHMWAIKKSQELKMNKVKSILEENIISWQYFDWNKEKYNRRYVLASKIYKKVYKIKNGIEPEVQKKLDGKLSEFYKNMEEQYAKENN
jgi:hypothetical protein